LQTPVEEDWSVTIETVADTATRWVNLSIEKMRMHNRSGRICGDPQSKSQALKCEIAADILEGDLDAVIQDWLARVEKEADLTYIPLNFEERTGHLPQLLHSVIARLRLEAGTKAPISEAASAHGDLRRKQGYTVAMVVEESRLLQVSIFSMLRKDVKRLDYNTLLRDVVTIADEVDAQLKQQMLRFMAADAAEVAK
jgi:hypothetical protein